LGLRVGWTIVKVPSDIAKLLIWKSIKLPSDISDKVGVRHVVSAVKFLTPNFVKRQLVRLRKKIPVTEWKFTLGNYVYTIATGSFGIKAYKSKIVTPQIISKYLTQPIQKSKGRFASAIRKSKAKAARLFRSKKLTNMYSKTKSKFKNMFKKVRIPNSLKGYFSRLTKR